MTDFHSWQQTRNSFFLLKEIEVSEIFQHQREPYVPRGGSPPPLLCWVTHPHACGTGTAAAAGAGGEGPGRRPVTLLWWLLRAWTSPGLPGLVLDSLTSDQPQRYLMAGVFLEAT